ncbi:TonB-dependent siderophore receptor [Nitrosococcus halophilus Nc 4]|uniref:TonB-dependent siderophore receptor n=1 Tax=Nitrosococcus halophilus (strain Nc4) TaxID=472759 RepID=D5C328_NITHN|nr:TonB-dependent siderophore receptor [Nitrosococcus halophilus]ADE14920.1 TonB-dependent siderophore receptor [Nitrosococcus halophilus Nc 4]
MTTVFRLSEPNTATTASNAALALDAPLRCALSLGGRRTSLYSFKARVEILKGPSALQAGFGAPGGLVNYVTKRPAFEPINALHVVGNEFGNIRAHADFSRRTDNGNFGVRVNAAWEEQKSFVDQVESERPFVSLAADWRITPDTLFQFDVEHEERDQITQPDLLADVNGNIPSGFDPETFLGQTWATFPTTFTLVSGKLEHFLSDQWSIVAEGNWMRLDREQNSILLDSLQPNGDATVFLFFSPDQTREPFSARAMIRGELTTGPIAHELAFGYSDHRLKTRWGDGFFEEIGTTNIFNPVSIPDPSPQAPPSFATMRIKEQGVFAHDILSFGEAWKLHLGGRYTGRDEKSFDSTGALTARFDESVLTPSVALVFKPLSNISTYVSYIEGLEAGGVAPLGTTNQNQQLGPLTSNQIEIGAKVELDEMRAEAALFQIDRTAEIVNAANTFVQDGSQIHRGVEFSVTGRITPEWIVFGSAMLLDAELKDMEDPAIEGNRPSGVPGHRMALVTEYAPRVFPGLVFSGSWTRTGSRPLNDFNTGDDAPDFDVFGLGARYNMQLGGTLATLRVNVDNLLDKRHFANAQFGILTPGAPRTVSASMSVRF